MTVIMVTPNIISISKITYYMRTKKIRNTGYKLVNYSSMRSKTPEINHHKQKFNDYTYSSA